jgi:broad specificity phosphatase PhoE
MEIILLRHGKPDLSELSMHLSAHELSDWVKAYDRADLCDTLPPTEEALAYAASCRQVICSDLLRSRASAEWLGVTEVHGYERLFREAELPYARLPTPRMPIQLWAVMFRLLWLAGYSGNGESLRAAKRRACLGSLKLQEMAREHGRVMLVGHGVINHMIAGCLRKEGWQGPRRPARGHWAATCYSLLD